MIKSDHSIRLHTNEPRGRNMRVGGINFAPYIYNTNALSGNSLSKVAPIGKDLLSSKTDFSPLANKDLNENPLRKGQTSNWVDVLDMQMQMGRMNAARIMKPVEEMQELSELSAEDFQPVSSAQEMLSMRYDRNLYQMQRAAEAYRVNMIA